MERSNEELPITGQSKEESIIEQPNGDLTLKQSNDDSNLFCLRSYQAEMVEESLRRNIIVAMDTGAGKTHIAISRAAAELETCEPHQLVWFLAPTVTLCEQQHRMFEKYLPAHAARFLVGNDNVDRWSNQGIWDEVLGSVRIVVSTPAVLLDAMTHGFVKMARLALLIFDEAHRCQGKHPANLIMHCFYHPLLARGQGASLPKILGLTASPVVNGGAVNLRQLERSLDAIARTPKVNRAELLRFTHTPELRRLTFDDSPSTDSTASPMLCALAEGVRAFEPTVDTKARYAREESRPRSKTKATKVLTTFYTRATRIADSFGKHAAEFYIQSCIEKFELLRSDFSQQPSSWLPDELECLRGIFTKVKDSKSVAEPHFDFHESLRPQAKALVDHILSDQWRDDTTCIIFVKTRDTVAVMDYVLSNHPRLQELLNVGSFVGSSNSIYRKAHLQLADLVDVKHQQKTLEDFRVGKKNLIVATDVLEEGIDVSICNMVICYDGLETLKSFIQRRGRARKPGSKFFIMYPRNSTSARVPSEWIKLEEEMKRIYMDDERVLREAAMREQLEEKTDSVYCCENTGAKLTMDNSVGHLYHFCAVLDQGLHFDRRPQFLCTETEDGRKTATVTLPSSVSPKLRQHRGAGAWMSERAAYRDAAFQAYIALHKAGLVNDNLLPLLNDPEEDPELCTVAKRKSTENVSSRLDPWLATARLVDCRTPLWDMTKVMMQLDGQTTSLIILLPQSLPRVPDFFVYWNEEIRYLLNSEPMGTITLSEADFISLQHSTRAILCTIFNSRMTEERYDFPFLLTPYSPQHRPVNQLKIFSNGSRSLLEVYEDSVAGGNPTIGLVRPKCNPRQMFIFRRFWTCDSNMEYDGSSPEDNGPIVQVVVSAFPKRRDFLHPVQGTAQHPQYTREHIQPANELMMDELPVSLATLAAFLPSVLHRYELFMIVEKLCNTILEGVGYVDRTLVLRAITASSTNERDYQRLEFLGDCILKFATAVQLMADKPDWPESFLTKRKDRIVSNDALYKGALALGLDRFIITRSDTGKKWRPRYVEEILASATNKPSEEVSMSTKTLADVVEALIGAAYVEGDMAKALKVQRIMLPSVQWVSLRQSRLALQRQAAEDYDTNSRPSTLHLERLEELIGYKFRQKYILLAAVTHPSWAYRDTSSYQRLEYLGDSVLDYILSRRLYAYRIPAVGDGIKRRSNRSVPRGRAPDELAHNRMHEIRAALVNGSFLAFLCMETALFDEQVVVVFEDQARAMRPRTERGERTRTALWQFMRHSSPSLHEAAAAAAARYDRYRDAVWTELRHGSRYPWRLLAKVDADKFFSDLIEAVLGAIFIDSCDQEMGEDGDMGDLTACEGFLERIGLMQVLDRILRDDVECLHPKSLLGRLGGSEKVVCEREEVNTAQDGRIVKCRVWVGERCLSDWVEGRSREDADMEAVEQAMVTLRAWNNMNKSEADAIDGTNGETGDDGVVDLAHEVDLESDDDHEMGEADHVALVDGC